MLQVVAFAYVTVICVTSARSISDVFLFHIGSKHFHCFFVFVFIASSVFRSSFSEDSTAAHCSNSRFSRLFPLFLLDLFLSTRYPLCRSPRNRMLLWRNLSHEDIAVFGQFYAEVITYRLYPCTKCPVRDMRISNKFYQGAFTAGNSDMCIPVHIFLLICVSLQYLYGCQWNVYLLPPTPPTKQGDPMRWNGWLTEWRTKWWDTRNTLKYVIYRIL